MNNDINEKIVHAAPVPPFVRFVASAVPMVFDNSLSYYECLCALWKWMQDNLVGVINHNATVTEHYIDLDLETRALFNQLKTYVDTYFDNLDVQDEINNKLDEMAEAGTLQEIITAYLQANVAWTFDTVADMKQATNLVDGSYARTLGFHSINDGGGALYKITNAGTANEMDIIAIDSLFANLIYSEKINAKQLGAYGDDTHDDTDYLQHAIDLAYSSKIKSVYLPNGIYLVSEPLEIYENKIYNFNYEEVETRQKGFPPSQLTICGDETNTTMIKCTAGNYILNGYATTPKGYQDLTVKNITFNGNNIAKSTIQMDIVHFGGFWIIFKQCRFNKFTECAIEHDVSDAKLNSAVLRNCIKLIIDECYITSNENGLMVGGDDTVIRNCTIQDNTSWGIIIKGNFHNYTIDNCKIQYNGAGKTLFTGGQIITKATGDVLTIQKTYFEGKAASGNDTGFMVFDVNTDSTNKYVQSVSISECYFNAHDAPTCFNRIGEVRISGFTLTGNRFYNLVSDNANHYLITTADAVMSSGAFYDEIQLFNNRINFKNSSNVAWNDYLIINEVGKALGGKGGAVDTSRGVWTPNCITQRFHQEMPTIIAGDVQYNGNLAMRSIGDFTVTKDSDTDGLYHITFTKPINANGYSAGASYPVYATTESTNIRAKAFISNKSANGFDIKTGTWDSTYQTFTQANLGFNFIAVFLTNW